MATIDRCDVYLCVADLSEPRGPSSGWYDTRESVLVRLGDTDGRSGWGEAGLRPGVVEAARELGVTLLGADPRRAGTLLDQLTRTTADQWAVSALSVALDDLRARQLGVSVADLYGGRRRDAVRAYASTAGYHASREPEELWPAEVAEALAAGFGAIKFRIGRYPAQRELAILAGIRSAHGADIEMMADGNGAYSVPQSFRVARGLGELGFTWLEEPHAWGGAVLIAATLQLLAVTPEPTEVDGTYGGLLEWDVFENPMRTGLLAEPLEVRDGLVEIPAGPGLGVEVDESAVRSLDRLAVR